MSQLRVSSPPPRGVSLASFASLALAASLSHAADLPAGGYSESFDGMGVAGTTPSSGWSVLTGSAGTSNATWTTTITANGANSVALMVASGGALTAVTTPSTTNNSGFNAAASASTPSDRVLATSPTTVSGGALELLLTNNTGYALDGLMVAFDTVRFTSVSSANQLPGYWLFYSLDGASWTNVASLNPTIATVPNTVGVTSTSGSFSFSQPVAVGAGFRLRWVDDNATQTSPDQIIGLNNVSISAVPESSSLALMLAGVISIGAVARRRQLGSAH